MFNVQNSGTLIHPIRLLNLYCTLLTPAPRFPAAPISAPGSLSSTALPDHFNYPLDFLVPCISPSCL